MKAEVVFYGKGWGNAAETSFIQGVCAEAEKVASALRDAGIPAEVCVNTDPCGGEVYVVANLEADFHPNGENEGGWGIVVGDRVFAGIAFDAGYFGNGGATVYLLVIGEVEKDTIKPKKVVATKGFSCTVMNAIERELKALAQEEVAGRV